VRCYRGRKAIPAGAATRQFALLSPTEKLQAVRRLSASGVKPAAIGQLTGLSVAEVRALLESWI
jgi:hypothetical protein